MRTSHIVVGMINESKQQSGLIPPREREREAPASEAAAVATGLFMFLGKRCLQWKERKTLPALKESGKLLFWKANGVRKNIVCSFIIDTIGWKLLAHQLSPNYQEFHDDCELRSGFTRSRNIQENPKL